MSSLSSQFSEKPSSFSQTCSLLSQYLKDNKGILGDLSLGINGMPTDVAPSIKNSDLNTMDLFPTMVPDNSDSFTENPETPSAPSKTRIVKSMDLFPQHSGFGQSVSDDEVAKVPSKVDHSVNKPVQETSEMTIFYKGQTFVFKDISENKLKEIMAFASKATYQVPSIYVAAPIQRPREISNTIGLNYTNSIPIEKLSSPIAIDLPMARKASLSRFFEKRKERISAKAPYQKSYSRASPPKENKKSWLGLSPQFSSDHYEHQS